MTIIHFVSGNLNLNLKLNPTISNPVSLGSNPLHLLVIFSEPIIPIGEGRQLIIKWKLYIITKVLNLTLKHNLINLGPPPFSFLCFVEPIVPIWAWGGGNCVLLLFFDLNEITKSRNVKWSLFSMFELTSIVLLCFFILLKQELKFQKSTNIVMILVFILSFYLNQQKCSTVQ